MKIFFHGIILCLVCIHDMHILDGLIMDHPRLNQAVSRVWVKDLVIGLGLGLGARFIIIHKRNVFESNFDGSILDHPGSNQALSGVWVKHCVTGANYHILQKHSLMDSLALYARTCLVGLKWTTHKPYPGYELRFYEKWCNNQESFEWRLWYFPNFHWMQIGRLVLWMQGMVELLLDQPTTQPILHFHEWCKAIVDSLFMEFRLRLNPRAIHTPSKPEY